MVENICKVALFWDKSFLWGLIAYRTFRELEINFGLLSSEDIRGGQLDGYDVLFVPGGWASDKFVALGDQARELIRDFVGGGGGYLGICGGAGLALSHENGLALAAVGRMPSSIRVPSFSGLISLEREAPKHPMWRDIPDGTAFSAWWPGQFSLDDESDVRVLARYGKPENGYSYVTDIPVLPDVDWNKWEKSYGLNLNPQRMKGEPAVIEAAYGKGKAILSYPHFESHGDYMGHRVLISLLGYLSGGKKVTAVPVTAAKATDDPVNQHPGSNGEDVNELPVNDPSERGAAAIILNELEETVSHLITFGILNFLWRWRDQWLLQWRRGVRGIEYSTLFAMIGRLRSLAPYIDDHEKNTVEKIERLRDLTLPFIADARRLLMLERFAMNNGPLSPLKTDDDQILALREKLFSNSKRCGGMYEEIIELTDEILMPLLRKELEGRKSQRES